MIDGFGLRCAAVVGVVTGVCRRCCRCRCRWAPEYSAVAAVEAMSRLSCNSRAHVVASLCGCRLTLELEEAVKEKTALVTARDALVDELASTRSSMQDFQNRHVQIVSALQVWSRCCHPPLHPSCVSCRRQLSLVVSCPAA